jgi:hypothetical protein
MRIQKSLLFRRGKPLMNRSCALTLGLCLCVATSLHADDEDKQRVDKSVTSALEFLLKRQEESGAWTGPRPAAPAVTSLCVRAYLSAGHAPGKGPYGNALKQGIKWVLKQQDKDGFLTEKNRNEMYNHGIASLMLAEAVGKCEEDLGKEVRAALERAVTATLAAQRTEGLNRGSWRYARVATDGDMSITPWHVLTLYTAKLNDVKVPDEKLAAAVDYVKRCRDPDRGVGFYTIESKRPTVACTAASVVVLEVCDKQFRDSPQRSKSATYLASTENRPVWGKAHSMYNIYYGSQAAFHVGGKSWDEFRDWLHKELIKHQRADGSWLGADASSAAYGADYCTAMMVLALTVDRCHLPEHQRKQNADK